MTNEAAQWHYVAPRPAFILEVTAGQDPRLLVGINTTATYGWLASDPSDTPALQQLHTGLISLTGSQSQYVNLMLGSGASSIGQSLATTTLGSTATPYVLGVATGGLSFEVSIKFPALPGVSSKVFEVGNGQQSNEVVMSYVSGSNAITFNSYRTGLTSPADVVLVSNVQVGVWYHLVVTLSSATTASSTLVAYVNGQVVTTISNAVYPAAMARTQATIGMSSWTGEGYLTALLDSFRVYDYTLSAPTVTALYGLTTTGLPTAAPVPPAPFNRYTAGPQLAYTLDLPFTADSTALNLDTNYTWTASSSTYPNPDGTTTPHTGVAVFNGVHEIGNSIDMTAYPDSLGRTFNFSIGGSMSMECWFLYYAPLRTSIAGVTSANGYDYVFNFGGVLGINSNNLGLTTIGWGSQIMFTDFLNGTTQHVTDTAGTLVVATPGTWQHVIVSIQQLNASVSAGTGGANCTIYYAGVVRWTQLCNVPQWVLRPNAFLGRSPDINNLRHWGEIDSFYLYNHALSAEEAAVHYMLPRAPLFEVVFDRDPQLVTAATTNQYSWAAGSGAHSGLLALSGSQFVDLNAYTGANSVGTSLSAMTLTGAGVGVTGGQYGWTLEVNLQLTSASSVGSMVVLDIGTGVAGTDQILLQFPTSGTATCATLQLVTYGGTAGTTATTVPIAACLAVGQWYSIVVTASVASTTATTATYTAYVNGVAVGTPATGAVIRSVARPAAYLGKSTSSSSSLQPFVGWIDSVRFVDAALTSAQVAKLASVTNPGGAPPVSGSSGSVVVVGASSSSSSSSSTAAVPSFVTSSSSSSSSSASPVPYVTSSTRVSSPSSSSSFSSSSSPAPAGTGAPGGSSSSSLSGGAIAGIVIGGVVGLIVLLCIVWLLLCSSFGKGKKWEHTDGSDHGQRDASHAHDQLPDTSQHRAEDEVEMAEVAEEETA